MNADEREVEKQLEDLKNYSQRTVGTFPPFKEEVSNPQ